MDSSACKPQQSRKRTRALQNNHLPSLGYAPLTCKGQVHIIEGPAGTAKTFELISYIEASLNEGTPAETILVCATTPSSATLLMHHLNHRLGAMAHNLTITTMQGFELELLSRPDACKLMKRNARVLFPFEETFLIEDLKTTGTHPKRVKDMLRFFKKSWVDLEPFDEEWFFNTEEKTIYNNLVNQLAYRKAYLAGELPRQAWEYLQVTPVTYSDVYVENFQLLSYASQACVASLAQNKLVVTTDPLLTSPALEEFPNPSGVSELAEANPTSHKTLLTRSEHTQHVTRALNQYQADETLAHYTYMVSTNASEGTFEIETFENPQDETEGVVRLILSLLQQGEQAEEIALIGTSKRWLKLLKKACLKHNLPLRTINHLNFENSFAEPESCPLSRATLLMLLLANPSDTGALRAWCGYGDYLANSRIFDALCAQNYPLSLEGKVNLPEAETDVLLRQEQQRINSALEQGRNLRKALKKLRGNDLFEAAYESLGGQLPLPSSVSSVLSALPNNAEPAIIAHALQNTWLFPQFRGIGITLGTSQELCALSFENLIVSGLVNGLIPQREYFDPTSIERDKRPAMLERIQKELYAGLSTAHDNLYFATFKEASLEEAEALRLKIERVRLRHGVRMCEVKPSETIRTLTGVYFSE
jgi:hypothetical protein